ncbi:MAG: hypothetical protein PHR35_10065 [Kiritimatiellae bacterium]|nr:hypothetical protein [Kiritimatiellia bacterium]
MLVFSSVRFTRAESAWRDPFWPVGYQPASEKPPPKIDIPRQTAAPIAPVAPKPVADWPSARKLLIVTGYAESRSGARTCLLNGKLVQVGDMVSILHKNMQYKWRILEIARDSDKMKYEEVYFGPPQK